MSASTPPRKLSRDEAEHRSYDFSSSPFQNDMSNSTTLRDHSHTHVDTDSDTESNTSDEFDWDAEEDGTAGPAVSKKARRGRRVWQLFTRLARPLRIVLVALIGAGILITPFLVVLFRFRNQGVIFQHVRAWSIWLAVSWGAACLTTLVTHLMPNLIVNISVALYGKPPQNLLTQIELLMAVTGWLQLCLDIGWIWIALSVTRVILHPPGKYWIIVNRAMQALFSASIILLVEKIFLQYVAIQFHKKALSERLAENRLALKALDKLAKAQPTTKKLANTGKRKNHKATPTSSRANSIDLLRVNGKESHLAIPDSVLPHMDEKFESRGKSHYENGRHIHRKRKNYMKKMIVDQVGDIISQIALKDSKLNRDTDLGGLVSARKLARKLFFSLSAVDPGRQHLLVSDFHPYFPSVAEAETAFSIFDKDNNGDISKKEMREAVQRIYRERKALTAGLKDVGSAVAKLDAVLIAIALLAIAFVCLLVFNRTSTVASLVPLATIVLGFSFIFGHSAQLLFESLIFIFSTHVFDVGDLVMIDDQPLMVKEFGLFSTTFRRVDGQEIIAPNTLLASTKLIHNLRRSNSMWETTNLTIAYETPLEAIEQLKIRLQAYVATNNREWGGVGVQIDKMEYQNAITLIIAMEHKSNWQDWGARWGRRTQFMRNLKTILEDLEIGYSLPIQPVFMSQPSWSNVRTAVGVAEYLGNAGISLPDPLNRAPGPAIRVTGGTL